MPKYQMTKSRYINGVYIKAAPQEPAVVELPKQEKLAPDMTLLEDVVAPAGLVPPFAPQTSTAVTAEEFSKKPAEPETGKKPGRASDKAAV